MFQQTMTPLFLNKDQSSCIEFYIIFNHMPIFFVDSLVYRGEKGRKIMILEIFYCNKKQNI